VIAAQGRSQWRDHLIEDAAVQGRVTVSNAELDDMILLRSNGTPTYMLSEVVGRSRHGA